jgi:hypothetical protein
MIRIGDMFERWRVIASAPDTAGIEKRACDGGS